MHSSPLEDTLRLFGKERFRPMQRELMECALAGRSCIGILPTGSGKSLCYQIPAVLGDGVTVVVSPLIALMRDQVAGLEKLGVAIRIARQTLRIVNENIVLALGIKIAVLVLSAVGLAGMWAAVFADVGVAVIAILNASRMLRYKG